MKKQISIETRLVGVSLATIIATIIWSLWQATFRTEFLIWSFGMFSVGLGIDMFRNKNYGYIFWILVGLLFVWIAR